MAKSDACFDECIFDGDGSHCEKCTMASKAKNLVESTIRPVRDVLYFYICEFVSLYLYWCICFRVFVYLYNGKLADLAAKKLG